MTLLSTRASRQGVDISFTVCVFVWLRISVPRIKLAASNIARQFISVQGRECHILGNFPHPEAQNRTNWSARGPRMLTSLHAGRFVQHAIHAYPHIIITVEMRRRKRHTRDALFMEYRADVGSACVDIRPSPKTAYLLQILLLSLMGREYWHLFKVTVDNASFCVPPLYKC